MHSASERGNLKKPTVLATCGGCHAQQRNQQTRFSHMPLGQGKMECTSCHNPHGSTAPEAAARELDERDLLRLPRREARSVPVAARAGDRELRELPRSAWQQPREDAQGFDDRGCASSAIRARGIRSSPGIHRCRRTSSSCSTGSARTAISPFTARTILQASPSRGDAVRHGRTIMRSRAFGALLLCAAGVVALGSPRAGLAQDKAAVPDTTEKEVALPLPASEAGR